METINTSRAQKVKVDIYNYDELPLSITYMDKTVPLTPVAIDLTDYKFDFILNNGYQTIKTYTIDAGDLTTTFLSKTGADVNVLNMENMFEDIRNTQVVPGNVYTLIQVVTDDNDEVYAHIIYTINANRY